MQNNRIIGFVLLALGTLIELVVILWGIANLAGGQLQISGFLLLLLPTLLIGVALQGAALYVLRSSSAEARQMVEVGRQRLLLSALQSQGTLSLAQAALETNSSLDQVKSDIYDLVGKGLFSGYIDWNVGTLYARQARELRDRGQCPNCGAQLALAGKGVIRCPYCGTEIFL